MAGLNETRMYLRDVLPQTTEKQKMKESYRIKELSAGVDVLDWDKAETLNNDGGVGGTGNHVEGSQENGVTVTIAVVVVVVDELVMKLRSSEDKFLEKVLRLASENVFVPLTVGGGIRDFTDAKGRHYSSLEVASEYFRSGADKISIGSDAVYAAEEYLKSGIKTGKSSLEQISTVYGNQAVVVSVDPRRVYVKTANDVPFKSVKLTNPGPNGEEYAWYQCTVNGGREGRPIGAYELAKAVEELGAGEILLNSIDCDGQGKGFDLDLVSLISDAVSIPVIASSGAGKVEHFEEVFEKTNASAALAAGIFHRKEVPIQAVKQHLLKEEIEVRM